MKKDAVSIGPCLIRVLENGEPVMEEFLCGNCEAALMQSKYRGEPVLVCRNCNAVLDYPEAHKALVEYMNKVIRPQ